MFRKFFILITILCLLLQADFVLAQTLTPNDPYYNKQWYLDTLNMPEVWPQEIGSSSVVIAVIDSGVDIGHPDLHDNIWVNQKEIGGDSIDNDQDGYVDDLNGWDFIDNDNDPRPKYSSNCIADLTCVQEAIYHGTLISGIAAAVGNNSQGIAGIGWQTKIMPLRVLDDYGNGSTENVVQAIDYAIKNKADIINLSFVGSDYDGQLAAGIERAYNAGIVIVGSAGNSELNWVFNNEVQGFVQTSQPVDLDVNKRYPVCYLSGQGEKMLIGVASSDANNVLSKFSNYGSSCVDVVAPGQDVFGALVYDANAPRLNEYYGGNFSGTSLAAPVVAGIAALIKARQPNLTNKQIRDLILNNTYNIDNLNPTLAGKLGHGLIDPVKIFKVMAVSGIGSKLIKSDEKTIYYLASNGKRYVFPDDQTFLSWFDNFDGIKQVSNSDLAQIPFGGIITYRPGSLIKITTDPKVYEVSKGGVLRWLVDEQAASLFYGSNWPNQVHDVSDAFFTNYKLGDNLDATVSFNPLTEKLSVGSIEENLGL